LIIGSLLACPDGLSLNKHIFTMVFFAVAVVNDSPSMKKKHTIERDSFIVEKRKL
jgi:hypothetical protein